MTASRAAARSPELSATQADPSVSISPKLALGQPKYLFTHIPKAAGITFRDLLKRQYASPPLVYEPNNVDAAYALCRAPRADVAGLDLIMGHVPHCPPLREYGARFRWLTILRRPADRVLSTYHTFKYQKSSAPFAKRVREENMSFSSFLSDPEARYWIHAHLYFLSGIRDKDPCSDEVVETAMLNLLSDYEWFGLVERWEESMVLLERTCGMDASLCRHKNVHPPGLRYQPTWEERQQLAELLRHENFLYQLACRIFQMRIAEISDLSERVERLRERTEPGEQLAPVFAPEHRGSGASGTEGAPRDVSLDEAPSLDVKLMRAPTGEVHMLLAE